MARYTYESVTGPVKIEIDQEWAEILQGEDTDEQRAERKHVRPDHKYAPGTPLSLESLDYEGAWFEDRNNVISGAELSMDLERALRPLTELQRRYFKLTRIKGYSFAEIARFDGKDQSTVREVMKAAEKKVIHFFE